MLPNLEILARLLLAALLGSAIGFERERLLWAAGIRTHMLVCVGACLIMIVSSFGFTDIMGTNNVVLDPSRARRRWCRASAFSALAQSCYAAMWFEA